MMIGLHIMRPTSIAVAGGGTETASIRSDGGVDFANATSLSLNGVFTADYDNYMIVVRFNNAAAVNDLRVRLRLSGTDATGSDYTYQFLNADNTTVNAGRGTTTGALFSYMAAAGEYGSTGFIYGPALAQPTAFRSTGAGSQASVLVADRANTHSLSTAYDGITMYPASNSMTGMITVMGYAQ